MATASETQHPEVVTAEGRVRGRWRRVDQRGTEVVSAAFLGIPFAEAPCGELRFAAPQPKAPWDGVLDAAEFGATAQRGDVGVTLIPEPSVPGDATLNVNVFTPAPGEAAGLPVLVWIHGGGYFAGSPASPWYDGRNFNRDGVVTVSISYRLGFDGFGWIEDAPANRGVLDWLLALEWVQRNIAAFGGDPARVTIAGQSAGGGAVLTLLGMESAQHLFSGVYALSGALADVRPDRFESFGRALAETAGVPPTRAGWATLSEERVLELQQKATAGGLRSFGKVLKEGFPLGPAVDGELIRRPTPQSLRLGVGSDKPLVCGTTDDEAGAAAAAAAKLVRWVPTGVLLGALGIPRRKRRAYLDANAEVVARGKASLAARVLADQVFRVTALRVARGRGDAPSWLYRFAWPSGKLGFAGHCLDVPFFFDCLDGPTVDAIAGVDPPQQLADEVHAAAVAFISAGDPGWAVYDETNRSARVFDVPSRDITGGYDEVAPLV